MDILKALCAFGVVVVHQRFPGRIGLAVIDLFRIAVPIFFMITGYFYVDVQNSRREVIQIKKIFWLFLLSNVTYLLWRVVIRMPCGKNEIMLFLSEIFHWKTMVIFVFFNESPIQPHLWYLGAVLYVLVIVHFLKKLLKTHFDAGLCIFLPVLLVIGLVFGSYSLLLLHKIYPEYVFRNFLCEGIPFFSIGYFLRKKKKSYAISKLFQNKAVQLVLVCCFSVTTLLEHTLLSYLGFSGTREYFLSTIFLSIIVFSIFNNCQWNDKMPLLQYIGRELSAKIYIIHPVIIAIFNKIVSRTEIYLYYNMCRPIVVYGVSAAVSVLLIKLKPKLLDLLFKKKFYRKM